jgi:hypothetical protein
MSEITTTNISDVFTAETYTPYQMAEVVNQILESVELPTIPPQMIYGYVRQQYIPATRTEVQVKNSKTDRSTRQGWLVTKEAAVEWTEKYVSKKLHPTKK